MAEQKIPIWTQDQFYGGFSDDRFIGIPQSFRYAKGVETRKSPKSLRLSYASEKSTSTECTGLANAMVTVQSTGDVLAFLSNGAILRRAAGAGSWVKVFTSASAILNAIEYNGYIFWFTSGNVHRMPIGSIDNDWTGDVDVDFKTFLNGNSNSHPAIEEANKLYIGDGSFLAEIDNFMVFTGDKLKIFGDEEIRAITYGGGMMRIFGRRTAKIDGGHKYFWNGTSKAYNEKVFIRQIVHNAINDGGDDYIIAGMRPYLYISSGYEMSDIKRMPLVADTKRCFFSPNSMCFYDGLMVLAPAESGDASIGRGAWTFGRENKNYPYSLNFDYPTSNDNTTDTIGCVHNANGVLYMSWKNGSSYGIDVINTSKYRATGELHSRALYGSRATVEKNALSVALAFDKVKTGEKIEFYMRKDLASSWESAAEIKVDYTDESDRNIYNKEKDVALDIGDFTFLETKLVLTAGTNQATSPEVIEAEVGFDQSIELSD